MLTMILIKIWIGNNLDHFLGSYECLDNTNLIRGHHAIETSFKCATLLPQNESGFDTLYFLYII